MGARASKEDRDAGVGVHYVLLTGRRSSGKSRLLSGLGKTTWSSRGGTRADRETHSYQGIDITKLSVNVAGFDAVIAAVRELKRAEAGGDINDVCVWFQIDEARTGELYDAGRDLAALARAIRPLGVPLWVIVNVLDAKVLQRKFMSGFGVEGVAELTRMKPDDVTSVRGVVRRIVRVYVRDSGRDAGLGGAVTAKAAAAADVSQVQAALKGKHDFDA